MTDPPKPCPLCEQRRLYEQRCEMAAKYIRRGKVQAALELLEGHALPSAP